MKSLNALEASPRPQDILGSVAATWDRICADPMWSSTSNTHARMPLPLHEAVETGAPVGVVKVLLEAHEAAASVATKEGWLPLHLACKHEAPVEVVKMLLEAHNGGALVADENGWLPLHLAALS